MAKTTQTDDQPRKKKKAGSFIVWGILVLVMLGLGGFGVTNFGGGVNSIGKVGDREIDVNDYARALRQEMNAISAQFGQPVTFQQAQAFGIDQRVLQTVVTRAALDNEAARIGISAGDASVAAEITAIDAFKGSSGTFDREAYRFALDRNNLTEADFEQGIREDIARSVLQGAIVGGFTAPAALTDTLTAWAGERRSFSLLQLTEADLTAPVADPTEEELTAFYDANIDRFTKPEAKRITYVALLPETLAPEMEVDEAALRDLYDSRIDEFMIPEKRLVERLVFPTEADAQAARARLDAGEVTFDQLVTERGLSLTDVDMGDVSETDLGAAGKAVFALTEPGVAGPAPSDLGPALFRMNAILAAQETSFEDAKETLSAEMKTDAARRAISARIEEIDDLLASGADLEEVAAEAKMDIATIDYVTGAESPEGIAAYPDFREAADALQEGDFPEAIQLDDGALVALRLDQIVPPAPIPLDEVREDATAAWRLEATQKALAARAEAIKAEVGGGKSLGAFGIVSVTRNITRDGFVESAPADLLDTLFAMEQEELRVVQGDGFTGLLRLDTISPAETAGEDAEALRDSIAIRAQQTLAQDAFALFTNALSTEAGIQIDQTAVNAVNAQMN
ncbi:SurA N-terminal domain-containing protein [Rhodobacteraceae bacterium HSP-20]|uniref:SurA N-terminal domain-containing protein n=1 Tax=Paragemmobacter amnigenus TaxID=2852097 RepID=A0ABS6JBZ0_9RHOB|nr:peptidylprolyl isomerase [Rhodobacter amnigenus]MBU9699900.1 SurA N-terminal domain-containing protein [Rhodobacter amnigenus]MBV4391127.1 SurA N-terminal domain-containing protein [Rhodobacter amnigenus]